MALDAVDREGRPAAGDGKIEARVKEEAEALCARFPIYPG
jgi:hypothetical protein